MLPLDFFQTDLSEQSHVMPRGGQLTYLQAESDSKEMKQIMA